MARSTVERAHARRPAVAVSPCVRPDSDQSVSTSPPSEPRGRLAADARLARCRCRMDSPSRRSPRRDTRATVRQQHDVEPPGAGCASRRARHRARADALLYGRRFRQVPRAHVAKSSRCVRPDEPSGDAVPGLSEPRFRQLSPTRPEGRSGPAASACVLARNPSDCVEGQTAGPTRSPPSRGGTRDACRHSPCRS